MSLIEELSAQGISAEDLEKAASVRLFEKVAAEQNIDLSKLTDQQVEGLYAQFAAEILPKLTAGGEGGQPAQPAAQPEGLNAEKAASILLFQKVAADENVDLEALSEEKLNELYAFFLEKKLPDMIQEEQAKKASAVDVEEAQAKLAEVEILGRHMARSFHDETAKLADEGEPAASMSKKKKALLAAGGVAALGLGGYGATKGYKHLTDMSHIDLSKLGSAGLFDKLATDRANEILADNGVTEAQPEATAEAKPDLDALVNARAVEMLRAAGWKIEE
jgi:hypothetical protein